MMLDFDPEVAVIAAQPFWLRWRDDAGPSRRHAPDLFARMADGSGVIIEIVREGARRMLAAVLEDELATHIAVHAAERDEQSR